MPPHNSRSSAKRWKEISKNLPDTTIRVSSGSRIVFEGKTAELVDDPEFLYQRLSREWHSLRPVREEVDFTRAATRAEKAVWAKKLGKRVEKLLLSTVVTAGERVGRGRAKDKQRKEMYRLHKEGQNYAQIAEKLRKTRDRETRDQVKAAIAREKREKELILKQLRAYLESSATAGWKVMILDDDMKPKS